MIDSAEKNAATRINTATGNSLNAFKQSIHNEAVFAARNAFESEAKNLQGLISTSTKACNDLVKAAGEFITAVKQDRERVKKGWYEVLEGAVLDNALATLCVMSVIAVSLTLFAFWK